MKRNIFIILCVLCVASITFGVLSANKDAVLNLLNPQEEVDLYEEAVLRAADEGGEEEYTVERNGATHTLPLPDGSTSFRNAENPLYEGFDMQYLCLGAEYRKWVDKMQNLPGYEFSQAGDFITITHRESGEAFGVSRRNYKGNYELIQIQK